MKKAIASITSQNHKISTRDYYQIFTTPLMVISGAIILVRSFGDNLTLMPLLVGGGLLALGGYRLSFVIKFFKERRKWDHK